MSPLAEKTSRDEDRLIPARMINEMAYCPRLAYLEWVQGEFDDNFFTVHGRRVHERVDAGGGTLKAAGEQEPDDASDPPEVARSVTVAAERAGIIAKVDLVEDAGDRVLPVDFKRGRKPDLPEGAYEPERVQICAQAVALRENGYRCDSGIIYFAGSRQRVAVPIDDILVERTCALAAELRELADRGRIPPPLADSPKCKRCSLVGICLPDEVGLLAGPVEDRPAPRMLLPPADDAVPVTIQGQGLYVGKSGEQLTIKEHRRPVGAVGLVGTAQVNLMGNVQISTQAVRELCQRGIPLCHFSYGGWFYGMTRAETHKNIEARIAQHRRFDDPAASLALARRFVEAKIRNCRTLLRRNTDAPPARALQQLQRLATAAAAADSAESLLGIEGSAARVYFDAFDGMLKRDGLEPGLSFEGRNRRPPRDPVNALLSLAYAMLVKDLTLAASAAGLDPYLGFYHRPRYGRPALALDLMEEFRPLIADSTVIAAVNTGVIGPDDFVRSGGAVALDKKPRRAFIAAYERRKDQQVRHPVFGYQISYRQVLAVQARLLCRHLLGEIDDYPMFLTR